MSEIADWTRVSAACPREDCLWSVSMNVPGGQAAEITVEHTGVSHRVHVSPPAFVAARSFYWDELAQTINVPDDGGDRV